MTKTKLKEGIPKYIFAVILSVMTICLLIVALPPKEEKTVVLGESEFIEWTESRLSEENEIEYSLVDNGILEFDETLAAFVDKNVKKKGVYSHLTDEYTYIMVTVGEDEPTKAIQLYDVRANEKTLYVGYTFFDVNEEIASTEDSDISFMLIRLGITDRVVEGRIIQEK